LATLSQISWATAATPTCQGTRTTRCQSVSALVSARQLILACEHVCRIDIDGEQAGTGVLVAPTFVATAAHVIYDLVETVDGQRPRPKAGSLGRLTLYFGDAEDFVDGRVGDGRPIRPSNLKPAPLLHEWLAYISLPTSNERSKSFDINDVAGIGMPDGPWDLALIELAKPPRPEFVGAACHRLPLAGTMEVGLHVLHHPNGGYARGMPLLWSVGRVTGTLGTPGQHPVRLLHDANTAPGSSGAPCFNDNWEIVGLHQAGLRAGAIQDPYGPNRAVPVYHWLDRLEEIGARASTPYLAELDDVAPAHPVLGRRPTQDRIWRAMHDRASRIERLFVIRGEAGMGKSFTARLIKALVRGRGDLVIEVDVRNVQGDDAPSFINALKAALAPPAGPAVGPPHSGAGDRAAAADGTGMAVPDPEAPVLTMPARIVRNEAVPALLDAFEFLKSRTEHLWLVLDGFEAANLASPSGVPQVISELIARLDAVPQLRLILIGWKDTVAPAFAAAVEDLVGPSTQDVIDYLSLRYFPPAEALAERRSNALALFENLAHNAVPGGVETGRDAYDRVLVKLLAARAFLDMTVVGPAAPAGQPAGGQR
jgi:hypothetical protein